MTENISEPVRKINSASVEFKRVMAASIERWLDADECRTKKALCIDLGCSQPDLSHWLSDKTAFTMSGHLVAPFCRIVGDNSLIWHIRDEFGTGETPAPSAACDFLTCQKKATELLKKATG